MAIKVLSFFVFSSEELEPYYYYIEISVLNQSGVQLGEDVTTKFMNKKTVNKNIEQIGFFFDLSVRKSFFLLIDTEIHGHNCDTSNIVLIIQFLLYVLF